MNIYYDETDSCITFGVSKIIEALKCRGIMVLERRLQNLPSEIIVESIVISIEKKLSQENIIDAEGFAIKRRGQALYIISAASRGAMYGALDIAEQIQLYGIENIKEKTESPFLKMRGIKFNLPWEPYDTGEPITRNEPVCWDMNFWRQYIDMLAMNRYNCLTLWSRHPFHLMFRLEKYPETTYLSDTELEHNMRFFRELFGYARNRGIDTYIITWCVDIIPQVVKGLGLPPHFADYRTSHAVRQESEPIKDYFRECVKTLLLTYRELTGIGTSGSEEMVGDALVREKWVAETYLEGVKQSGRTVPFIHRTNQQSGKPIKDLFVGHYPGQTYISWKYSNAHMYSYPKPIFDQLWGAWEGVNMDEVKVTYTVRNDDIHTLRWGDPEYVREYVINMKKPYVHGFYWGADGYIWGIDFQHEDKGHKRWKYDFEKHWYQFALWGRMSYNPDLPEETWQNHFHQKYGRSGEDLFYGLKAASKIVPAVSQLFWLNYDFQWHPESCLSNSGYKTIKDFVNGSSMPGSGVLGIRDYVRAMLEGQTSDGKTPQDIISELERSSRSVMDIYERLKKQLRADEVDGELECILLDLQAWAFLGLYYREKFAAAVKLSEFHETSNAERKIEAIQSLEQARDWWIKLGNVWSQHYKPYLMTRTKMTFGWPLYIKQIEQDIEIAKGFPAREP